MHTFESHKRYKIIEYQMTFLIKDIPNIENSGFFIDIKNDHLGLAF
jgi:hypothetical protein